MQLQLFEGLNGCVEAGGVKKLDGDGSPCHLPLHGDKEIKAPKAHVLTRYPTNVMASHPWPMVIYETRKRPQPSMPTIGVLNRRLVNLCLRVWPGWCAWRTQGFILVQEECPYIQF